MTNDVLRRTAAGVVYGNVSLKVGESSFPHPDWTDFVVVVLTWWCQAVLQLLSEDRGLVEVRFMEGPFLVEIGVAELNTWHMSLVEAGLKRHVRDQADVECGPLIRSILDAADRTIAACRRQGWSSSDLDQLVAAAATVRKEAKRLAI